MIRTTISAVLMACGSTTPASPPAGPATQPVADAAVDIDASPDAGPSAALAAAPAWIFRFSSSARSETWTLRIASAEAMLDVQSNQGLIQFLGSAIEGDSISLQLATPTAKITLDCKRTKRAVGVKCNDAKAKKLDVLDCYHPDFKEPMPFGQAPGIEYSSTSCTGYRLIAP